MTSVREMRILHFTRRTRRVEARQYYQILQDNVGAIFLSTSADDQRPVIAAAAGHTIEVSASNSIASLKLTGLPIR